MLTRTRFDQFGKQMARAALQARCAVETDAEVQADARRIDLWFVPQQAGLCSPSYLGLLGQITTSSGTLELTTNQHSQDSSVYFTNLENITGFSTTTTTSLTRTFRR